MKKSLFVLALLIITNCSVFAAGKRVAIFNPTAEGLSQDEINWIPSSVRRKLESNFNDYTNFQIVDIQNEDKIKDLQKNAESYSHDQDTSIELGKLVSAEIAVFSTITKAGNKYILSSNITNLTTGVSLSSVTTESVEDCTKLFDGAGSSANKVTVKFCEDLGIKLSTVDLYELLRGSEENDELLLAEEEVQKYAKKQDDLNKKIKDTTDDSTNIKSKLEAEKILAEKQHQIALERLERLKSQQQRLAEDLEQQKKRSAEQREKIELAAGQAEQKAKLLRMQNIDNLSVDNQILMIEAKKQALVDMRANIEDQILLIKQDANDNYKIQSDEIDAEPLRNGETDSNGNILPIIKQQRSERKKEIKKQLEKKALEDIQSVQNKTLVQEEALYKDIKKDQQILRAKHTITSLQDDRILDIGNYAGEKYEWDTTISLYIDDMKIFSQKANLDYKSVSGKQPVIPSVNNNAQWNDYLDTVDMYDYMFKRNVPAVMVEVDYMIEAMPDINPSQYKLTLYEFRYIDIVSGKIIQKIQPVKTTYKFTVLPALDISYYSYLSADYPALNESNNKSSDYDDIKTGKDAKKRKEPKNSKTTSSTKKSKNVDPVFDQKKNGGARCNLGVNFAVIPALAEAHEDETDVGLHIEGYCSLPATPYMFGQIDFGVLGVPHDFGDYYSDSGVVEALTFDLGFNVRPRQEGLVPNFYILGGLGFAYDEELINVETKKTDSLLVYKAAAGIDIPVSKTACLTFEGGIYGLGNSGPLGMIKIGAALCLPDFVLN